MYGDGTVIYFAAKSGTEIELNYKVVRRKRKERVTKFEYLGVIFD